MPYLPSRSLRGRLFVLVLLVATSLCTLAALLIWQAYKNERAAVYRELGNTARAAASLVDQRVENLEAQLKGLVTVGELETGDLAAFYARAVRLTKPRHRWVMVIDAEGRPVLNTHVPFGAPLPPTTTSPELAAAIASGKTYVSNLTQSRVVGIPVIFVSTGIFVDGALRYRASLAVSPEEFAAGTVLSNTPAGHVIAAVDRNAVVVVRSKDPDKFVGHPATPDMVAAIARQREVFLPSRTLDGRDVLAAVVPAERSGWSIIVGAPVDNLRASARRLVLVGILTSLAILAAATAVAWWIARAAIHDVTALMADTRVVAEGRLPAESRTVLAETSAIATSLRATSARLHEELQERRRAEAELLRAKEALELSNQALEQKVGERTASLAELVRQMEEFTYSVSHDLRGPVRAMTSFGRVVLEDHGPSLAPDARALLGRIVAAGERMGRLIADLLEFSRVNQNELILQPIDLALLARGCVRDNLVLGAHADRIHIDDTLPSVLGHESFLHQALSNLLANAVKFVPPGVEPRVRVHAGRRGDFARLWIEDNGVGVDPAMHSKIFQVFERAHSDRRFDGTGIGLAIVRRAIERMGGRVGVESDGVNGSRFWIELRLVAPPRSDVDAPRGLVV